MARILGILILVFCSLEPAQARAATEQCWSDAKIIVCNFRMGDTYSVTFKGGGHEVFSNCTFNPSYLGISKDATVCSSGERKLVVTYQKKYNPNIHWEIVGAYVK